MSAMPTPCGLPGRAARPADGVPSRPAAGAPGAGGHNPPAPSPSGELAHAGSGGAARPPEPTKANLRGWIASAATVTPAAGLARCRVGSPGAARRRRRARSRPTGGPRRPLAPAPAFGGPASLAGAHARQRSRTCSRPRRLASPRRLAGASASAAASAELAAVASFHLSVKTVKRSAGRSATAAAAYRHAERIECQREGRVHDYRAKSGVEHSFILAPEDAPAWAQDREALWNAAEAREMRRDSVVAREWELALPAELDGAGRRVLVAGFARELVARYGVVADVAIHAPHREGDQRNWHAHVQTTTRSLTADGLTAKTVALDAKATGGPEIAHMRERWAALQNQALERAGHEERVDHRSLVAQREAALVHGDEGRAEALDRAAEVKLGPVVSAVERREQRAAERDGFEYVPVTERGAQVHEARAARALLAELVRVREAVRQQVLERAAQAREAYALAREQGTDHVRAGLAALRAAAQRQGIGHERGHGLAHGESWRQAREPTREERGHGEDAWQEREASRASIRERLAQIREREGPQQANHAQDGPGLGFGARRQEGQPAHGEERHQGRSLGAEAIREELERLRERARPGAEHEEPGHDPINERLRALLARERAAAERHGPVARLVERVRDEPAWAPSFPTHQEARAFREEMERRFDPGTLARLGRGEERALAQVAESRLDGLCVARAWLDAQGEPERSEARMSLAYRIVDAQAEARRERDGHEEKGHSWGL